MKTIGIETLICGHSWEAIQRAQQGGKLHAPLTRTDEPKILSDADRALIAKYGVDGLAAAGFLGTLDKVQRGYK